jgi:hypothetical protein
MMLHVARRALCESLRWPSAGAHHGRGARRLWTKNQVLDPVQ